MKIVRNAFAATLLLTASGGVLADVCDSVGQISQQQCRALVDFFKKTGGEHYAWKRSDGWLQNSTPCQWYGVTCWGDSIAKLVLPENGLAGQLNRYDFAQLPQLRYLDLSNNKLQHYMPDFSKNTKLRELKLSGNSLLGFIPDTSPLPELTKLHVARNPLEGPVPNFPNTELDFDLSETGACRSPTEPYSSRLWQTVAQLPACDPDRFDTIFPASYGVEPYDGRDDSALLNYIILQQKRAGASHSRLEFRDGQYHLACPIRIHKIDSLEIVGPSQTFPPREEELPQFVKTPTFGQNCGAKDTRDGAMFDIRYATGISISGLVLQGLLTDPTTYYKWSDHGIYLGSTHFADVRFNYFRDLGDTAVLVTTDLDDTSVLNSQYNHVSSNVFNNINRIGSRLNGRGTRDVEFVGNTIEHLKDSIWFNSGIDGAGRLFIGHNTIRAAGTGRGWSHNHGIQVTGFSDVTISNNDLANGDGVGIKIGSHENRTVLENFDWRSVTVSNNRIGSFSQGIVIYNLARNDGYLVHASDFQVNGNELRDLTQGDTKAAIHWVGSNFHNARITNNTVFGGNYLMWPASADWMTQNEGNALVKN